MFFFVFFSVRHENTRQPFSGTAERIFMKLLPNNSGENGVCIAVPINFLVAKNYTLRTWLMKSEKLLYAGLLAMALCTVCSYGGCVTNA